MPPKVYDTLRKDVYPVLYKTLTEKGAALKLVNNLRHDTSVTRLHHRGKDKKGENVRWVTGTGQHVADYSGRLFGEVASYAEGTVFGCCGNSNWHKPNENVVSAPAFSLSVTMCLHADTSARSKSRTATTT